MILIRRSRPNILDDDSDAPVVSRGRTREMSRDGGRIHRKRRLLFLCAARARPLLAPLAVLKVGDVYSQCLVHAPSAQSDRAETRRYHISQERRRENSVLVCRRVSSVRSDGHCNPISRNPLTMFRCEKQSFATPTSALSQIVSIPTIECLIKRFFLALDRFLNVFCLFGLREKHRPSVRATTSTPV